MNYSSKIKTIIYLFFEGNKIYSWDFKSLLVKYLVISFAKSCKPNHFVKLF